LMEADQILASSPRLKMNGYNSESESLAPSNDWDIWDSEEGSED
jgi:hypothetical protein